MKARGWCRYSHLFVYLGARWRRMIKVTRQWCQYSSRSISTMVSVPLPWYRPDRRLYEQLCFSATATVLSQEWWSMLCLVDVHYSKVICKTHWCLLNTSTRSCYWLPGLSVEVCTWCCERVGTDDCGRWIYGVRAAGVWRVSVHSAVLLPKLGCAVNRWMWIL
jgi:hypothetical protein